MEDQWLKQYIKEYIFPIYDKVDIGHNVKNHIIPVIEDSLNLGLKINGINFNILYTVAAYHDIGLIKDRKNYHIYSRDYVLNDKNLKKWFIEKEIKIIVEAVEDHRA